MCVFIGKVGGEDDHSEEFHSMSKSVRESIINNPNDDQVMQEARNSFYHIILDKAITIKFLCCAKFAAASFKKGQAKKVNIFEKTLRFSTMVVFTLEVIVTIIDLFLSKDSRNEARSP